MKKLNLILLSTALLGSFNTAFSMYSFTSKLAKPRVYTAVYNATFKPSTLARRIHATPKPNLYWDNLIVDVVTSMFENSGKYKRTKRNQNWQYKTKTDSNYQQQAEYEREKARKEYEKQKAREEYRKEQERKRREEHNRRKAQTPFEIFGIKNNRKYTEKEIKTIYRKLALKYHPDANSSKGIDTTEKMKEINKAYSELINMC